MAYASEVERLEQLFKDRPEQYFAPLAEAYRKAGNIDFALEVLRVNLEKRPTYVSAHIVLGRCYLDQKNDAEAARAFENVLKLDGENIIALRILGEISERQGNPDGAYRWVKRLLEVDPMNDEAQEAIKRLQPPAQPTGAPATARAVEPEQAPVTTPASSTAPIVEPAAVSGFEPTSSDQGAILVESQEGPDLVAGSGASLDMGIERSESAMEPSTTAPRVTTSLELSRDLLDPGSAPVDQATERSAPVDQEPERPAPVAQEQAPPASEPRRSGRNRVSVEAPGPVELPLIMPEEMAPEAAETPSEILEPEPVITETMAEVYVRQGLLTEARDVYRRLLEQRPKDAALRARLDELSRRASAPKVARFGAASPGGVSARSLLSQVLSARPGSAGGAVVAPPAVQPPPGPTALDHAFANEAPPAHGAPTRPTTDELSLAAVFGEEGAVTARQPVPSPDAGSPAPVPSAPAAAPSGFSFDEFFGGKKDDQEPAAAQAPPAEASPPEDFLSWLKGLKS